MKRFDPSAFLKSARKITATALCLIPVAPVFAEASDYEYGDNPLEAKALELSKEAIKAQRFITQSHPENTKYCVEARAKLDELKALTATAEKQFNKDAYRDPGSIPTNFEWFETATLENLWGYTAAQIDEKCQVMPSIEPGSRQEQAHLSAKKMFDMVNNTRKQGCAVAPSFFDNLVGNAAVVYMRSNPNDPTPLMHTPEGLEIFIYSGPVFRNCLLANWPTEMKKIFAAQPEIKEHLRTNPDAFYKTAEKLMLNYRPAP